MCQVNFDDHIFTTYGKMFTVTDFLKGEQLFFILPTVRAKTDNAHRYRNNKIAKQQQKYLVLNRLGNIVNC